VSGQAPGEESAVEAGLASAVARRQPGGGVSRSVRRAQSRRHNLGGETIGSATRPSVRREMDAREAFATLDVANDALADGDEDRCVQLRTTIGVDFERLGCSRRSPQPPWRRGERWSMIQKPDKRRWLTSSFSGIDLTFVVRGSRFLGDSVSLRVEREPPSMPLHGAWRSLQPSSLGDH
jgi:hypothetical protein